MSNEKLPIEFKKKWIAALRSGKYKQGTRGLYTLHGNSYCCLGVAAKVLGKVIPEESGMLDSGHGINTSGIPPILIGCYSATNDIPDNIPSAFAVLNDNGVPFEVIAGFIDANL